jgi:hypothetical protein
MQYRLASSLAFSLSLLAAILSFSPVAICQNVEKKAVQAANARAGQPVDLSGVWDSQHRGPGGLQTIDSTFHGEIPPLTPWGEERFLATRPSQGPRSVPDSTDPVYPTKLGAPGCFPPGVPRIYLQIFPMEIIQIPGRVLMRFEFDHSLREIWVDGRGHPPDLNPTYMGNSIGKWEGDTLVVDTVGFNDKTWLDREGRRHSDQLHIIERFRRTSQNTLADDITMEDPKTFTKPWTTQITFELRPDWEILEHACADYVNFDEVLKLQGQTK